MPKKRDEPPTQPDVARQKRAKLQAARAIPVQPASAGLKDGELDLQAFVAAHEFEIRALEQSMAGSRAVGASRAFQKVPRSLRRRTASHNAKRVPRRLRARARREMVDDKTPTVEARRRKPTTTRARLRVETAKKMAVLAARKSKGEAIVGRTPRPKIRRNQLNEPPRPESKFRRRQINKTWLPTHAWHAKRARMTDPKNPLWRFAIPVTPNEKVYRLTHRSHGEKGTLVWDMSYMSTIGLYGPAAGLERVLRRLGVTQESCWNDGGGRRWRRGARSWSGMLSRETNGSGRRIVCPATIVWNALGARSADDEQSSKPAQHQVYLRVHPSAFLELFDELLRLTKMEKRRMYIEDLRFEIGSLELAGPASTEALLAILTPSAPRGKHAVVLRSLHGLTNPATLPSGALLTLEVDDPRVSSPSRQPPATPEAQMKLLRTIAEWPADNDVNPSSLFDRDARHRASCLPSQKTLNRRRASSSSSTTTTTKPPPQPPSP
ncbi:Ribonucleases P/MRP protein subunit pop1 [Ophiocordyceps camponoti-floridani]|uniref:Ribonucleases P/MRP protein subunit pop1 n=1 Tax=Ophiocordyceps camponoti-floridani TaxID=2030778 RepID=A0A8H4Q2R9_9HYPO|nr:Ribonucleases P/MRP protein subunit pop1 [Ophiocordyceps camponoti-floridani]